MTNRSIGFDIKQMMVANSNFHLLSDIRKNTYFCHLHFPIWVWYQWAFFYGLEGFKTWS